MKLEFPNDGVILERERDRPTIHVMAEPTRFDLEERTASFGEAVVRFSKTIRETAVTRPMVNQLVRAATSIGANYCAANDADSKSDFRWDCRGFPLRKTVAVPSPFLPESAADTRKLWQEARELNLILGAVIRSSKARKTPPENT